MVKRKSVSLLFCHATYTIRHCLYLSLSLNSCHQLICIGKADINMCISWGNLCVFVSVAPTVNCRIYWIYLTVCSNAIRQISPEILCNIPVTHRIHTDCHISIAVQQV